MTGVYAYQTGKPIVQNWPSDVSDDLVIKANDSFDALYQKLIAIYHLPKYKDVYKIYMSPKPLVKA